MPSSLLEWGCGYKDTNEKDIFFKRDQLEQVLKSSLELVPLLYYRYEMTLSSIFFWLLTYQPNTMMCENRLPFSGG